MLSSREMGAWLTEHLANAEDFFRLETLPDYRTPAEADEFQAWLAGQRMPDNPARTQWLAHISEQTRHQTWRKVHVVSGPLSDYERFHLEYGLALNTAAGEQNRVLEVPDRDHLRTRVGDFFVVDHRDVLRTLYNPDGSHRGAEVATGGEASALVAVADLAWEQAIPLPEWRHRHPEYRTAASAA